MENLDQQIQEGNTSQQLSYHTHNGVDSPIVNVSESSLNLSDVTTGDATTARHGLLPKLSGTATEFLDGTGDFDTVKDSDLSTSDITTNNATTSKHGFLMKGNNDSSYFLRGDITWAIPTVSKIEITITAGETLSIGDVVTLFTGTGSNLTAGYQMVNGTVYAVRASANDTTYGSKVLGIMTSTANYLGTGTCAIVGDITGLAGLTGNTKYYLSDYTGTSAIGISETNYDTEYKIWGGADNHNIDQLWIPTSSRLDKLILYFKASGGGADNITVEIKRGNTVIATASDGITRDDTWRETTFDFTDVRVFKGEFLHIYIYNGNYTASVNNCYIRYQSTGNNYNETYAPTSDVTQMSIDGSPISGASLYMKINEYPDFGKLASSAGTRKFKMGIALSATELALNIQEGDSIL